MDEIVLSAPEGATSLSFAGTSYEVVNGLVTLPAEAHAALADLRAHGFAPYSAPADTAPATPAGSGAGDDPAPASTTPAPKKRAAAAGAVPPPWA